MFVCGQGNQDRPVADCSCPRRDTEMRRTQKSPRTGWLKIPFPFPEVGVKDK